MTGFMLSPCSQIIDTWLTRLASDEHSSLFVAILETKMISASQTVEQNKLEHLSPKSFFKLVIRPERDGFCAQALLTNNRQS
jgi:hypothetical protein